MTTNLRHSIIEPTIKYTPILMLWLTLCLAAPAVWAITNVIDRFVLTKVVKNPLIPTAAFCITGTLAGCVIWLARGFSPLTPLQIIGSIATGALALAAEYLYFRATQHEEISRVISLIYLDPLFTTLLAAIFLGEIFSLKKYFGVIAIVAGAIAISYRKEKKLSFNTTVLLCVIAAFLFGAGNVLNKYVLINADFWTISAYIRFGTCLSFIPIALYKKHELLKAIPKSIGPAFLVAGNSALTMLGTFLFGGAIALGYVALTTSLAALQPFFVLVLTAIVGALNPHILKEDGGRRVFAQKLFAVVLMFIGVLLITS